MANYDLKSSTLQELKSLQKKVEREIADRDKRLRKEALNAVKDKAKQMGYSLGELLGDSSGAGTGAKGKTRAPAPPKYRSMDDPDRTWSGRGRPPFWIKEAQEKGIDIETMRIKDDSSGESTNT